MRFKEIYEKKDEKYKKINKLIYIVVIDYLENRLNNGILNNRMYNISDKIYSYTKDMLNPYHKFFCKDDDLREYIKNIDASDIITKMAKKGLLLINTVNDVKFVSLPETNDLIKKKIDEYQPIIDQIKTNCSDILSVYLHNNGNVLYRGMSSSNDIELKTVRTKRNPMDTPKSIQDLYDKVLIEKGFKAVRGNSAFCSGDYGQTQSYGSNNIIFPFNGFNFTYFANHADLYFSTNYLLVKHGCDEIEMKADRKSVSRKSINWIKNNIDTIMDYVNPNNDSIKDAINSKHEVMISDCKYYAVKVEIFRDFIAPKLGLILRP